MTATRLCLFLRSPVGTALVCCVGLLSSVDAAEPSHQAELVFPLHPQHNHAPGIVECPNGDLLVSWYRGSGERTRRRRGRLRRAAAKPARSNGASRS